ncbi:NAD-dependent epimerase/dehydratase family protein [Massilia sp. CCM 8694]|uniref:NAD-dependent epimerase/dehydratase family protein n=1 Tax=Massilia genomosp. 1 TaxID=2609280 RepID=A0ABX0N3J1_9BURK|nr:NAD(P)-dependent oxidoreductase [Massilia genomosp. 1]NHZ66948.1 NAD-dependent epimerase/dehydratase family protein [Massilia genomosp. 1]
MTAHKVLITGAAGRIGTAFVRELHGQFDLRLGDLDSAALAHMGGEAVHLDVTDLDACMRACAGVQTVLHLAADPLPDADFHTSLLPTNIVGSYNVFLAAKAQGCRRVVFASSAQAVEGYPLDVQVQENMAPRPKNMYGVSKAFGEALASLFADDGTLVTVAVRIANVATFHAGERHSARDVAAFISERDVVQLLARCIDADLSGFTVVHGVSDNRYKRLAIERTRSALDYQPRDDAFAILEGEAGDTPARTLG